MHNKWYSVEDLSPSGSLVGSTGQAAQTCYAGTNTHTLCTLHVHKTLQMREAQGAQSCVPGPVGVASRHPLPDPDTSPGDSSWYPNPKSVPFICFFAGLNHPAYSVSSPSCWEIMVQGSQRNQLRGPAVGWAHQSRLLEPWGHHSAPSHQDRALLWGKGRGSGTLPSWGIAPTIIAQTQLPAANLVHLRSSGRILPQQNSARWRFHLSLLCHRPVIPEFTMEKCFINSWIISLLIL